MAAALDSSGRGNCQHGRGEPLDRMKQLVVVGNGMAGVACVEQILKHRHDFEITIFGDETHVNYNRILLSLVLAGEKSAEDIVLNDIDWYQDNGIRARLGVRIERHRPRAARWSSMQKAGATPFDKLILATGSSAFIPPIPGVDKKNVHVFRTLDDTRALLEKARKGCKAVVIGGGLLGLEAARGLQLRGCDVSVVHLVETLMERQLDRDGGALSAAQDRESGHPGDAAEADAGAVGQRPGGRSAFRLGRGDWKPIWW